MKITCLTENTSIVRSLGCEHGLSLYIETASSDKAAVRILFDMGQTGLFEINANTLGIDIASADIAVLSHGHYDHGGGLKRFLEINGSAPVYIPPKAFEGHYNGSSKYIGLDTSLFGHERLVTASYPMSIGRGLTLYGGSDIRRDHDLGSFGLTMVKDGALVPDDFEHEQYLMIEENGKRVLLSGCSHRGIIDIAAHFRPDVIVGGFHFSKLPIDGALTGYAELLDSFGIEYYTCHCTGAEQFEHMKKHMKSLNYIAVGDSIIL